MPPNADYGDRISRLEERSGEDGKMLREIRDAVVGHADGPGLKGRVDRLETRNKVFAHIFGALFTVLSTIIAFFEFKKH